jgi:hypothetical protein
LRKAAPFFWASGNSGAGASHLRIMIGVYREFEGCMRLGDELQARQPALP